MSTFAVDDLVAGDILLYEGKKGLSWLIKAFDGSPYSHAALYMGNGQVAEAVSGGVKERPYSLSADASDQVALYRHRGSPEPISQVVDVATDILATDQEYAVSQFIMLGILCLVRRLPMSALARRVVRTVLDKAAEELLALKDTNSKPMICSELVYRCYDQALAAPIDEYSILLDYGHTDVALAQVRSAGGTTTTLMTGLEPGSLLAQLYPAQAAIMQERGVPTSKQIDPSELDRALRRFEEEWPGDKAFVEEREVSDDELRASVERFSQNLVGAAGPQQGPAMPFAADDLKLGGLFTIGDRPVSAFVTPRDLAESPSLDEIGVVE